MATLKIVSPRFVARTKEREEEEEEEEGALFVALARPHPRTSPQKGRERRE